MIEGMSVEEVLVYTRLAADRPGPPRWTARGRGGSHPPTPARCTRR
ncbi:hypothetical protein QJS66_19710 [Kocuria rhizophila]|nr:hypothetical protein QJS66_19710 [Kocuria rhizophila]